MLKLEKPRNIKGKLKRIKDYKHKAAGYLDAIYRKNKDLIDSRLPPIIIDGKKVSSSKTRFKNYIQEYIDQGYYLNTAIKKFSSSRKFKYFSEQFAENAYKTIKSDRQANKIFRELTKINGRRSKIELERFRWNKETKDYEYTLPDGRIVVISFDNSPKFITVMLK